MIAEKEKSVKDLTKLLNLKKGAPAPKEPKAPGAPHPKASLKSQGAPPLGEDDAVVKPQPSPKKRLETRDPSRSTSQNNRKIPCKLPGR